MECYVGNNNNKEHLKGNNIISRTVSEVKRITVPQAFFSKF